MKARDVQPGDWIKVGGKKVRVDRVDHTKKPNVVIDWSWGSSSGTRVRGGGKEVKRVYGKARKQ